MIWLILIQVYRFSGLGIINLHPDILPEYRGKTGYNLDISIGLSEWGLFANHIDDYIVTGSLIEVYKFKINVDKGIVKSLEATSQN